MPFFSGNRRGTGGFSGHTLLPSVSRPRRKPSSTSVFNPFSSRRRASILSSSSSTFFTLGLSASLLFFLFVIFHYGVPNLSSMSSSSKTSVTLRPPRKPTSAARRTSGRLGNASVDITTKDLYDRIEFLDVNGGAWTQGWKVSYSGSEWDSERLKVFVVPHSHNDPGWKLTVEEYYERQSRHILDTIVDSLSKNQRRKFIWEEMSYLERWWRDAPRSKREKFTKLVKDGQLEIVGGGWVMNDEANSHYFAIVEQILRFAFICCHLGSQLQAFVWYHVLTINWKGYHQATKRTWYL